MISIIITVYNKEEYVLETLQNAINSISKEDELVIINDGSTDNSSMIINDFCQKNKKSKIKFVDRKENKGVFYTKKEGLLNCSNDYVTFLDSDDLINSKFLKRISSIGFSKEKLTVFGIFEFYDSDKLADELNKNIKLIKHQRMNVNKLRKQLLKNDYQNSLSNKIYYKDFLIKAFNKVETETDYAEDLFLNLMYLDYIKEVEMYKNIGICYRKGIDSLTTKWTSNQFNRIALLPYNYRKKYIDSYNLNSLKYLPNNKYIEMTYTVLKSENLSKKEKLKVRDIFISTIKEYNYLLLFSFLNFKNKYRFMYILKCK